MKMAKSLLLVLTLFSLNTSAQDRTFFEDSVSFFCAIEKTETSGIVFKLAALDTMGGRTDSIFKAYQQEHGYWFTSYNSKGELVGIGSFHFHGTERQEDFTEKETDEFLRKSFNWTNLHVSTFANCTVQLNCDMFELYYCFGNPTGSYSEVWPGIHLGGQAGRSFTGEEIRRMPGR